VIDLIDSGFFTKGDRDVFRPLIDHLLNHDEYMLLADFQSYIDCQERCRQLISTANAGRACRFSTWRVRASSRPIGPSASTATRSGK
jgi:glucan phosphorylase